MRMKLFLLVSLMGVALGCFGHSAGVDGGADEKKPAEKKSAAEIEKLVKELGSANGPTRELASKELLKVGAAALPLLAMAMKSKDTDLRRRAESLHAEITEQTRFARAKALGLDLLVERTVRKGKDLTKDDWRLIVRIADAIRVEGIAKGSRIPEKGYAYLDQEVMFAKKVTQKETEPHLLFANRAVCESVAGQRSINASFLICSGDVAATSCVDDSIVLANGNVRVALISKSIVISDGDIEVDLAASSILIARGRVKVGFKGTINNCSVLENEDPRSPRRMFFSLSALGLDLKVVGNEAQVVTIGKESPFTACGLKAGDKIISVNSSKFDSDSSFRKLLRRAVDTSGTFEIRRGEEQIQLKFAPLP